MCHNAKVRLEYSLRCVEQRIVDLRAMLNEVESHFQTVCSICAFHSGLSLDFFHPINK